MWSIFSPMRREESGNHSEEEVCSMLGIYCGMEREWVEDGKVECPPQWVSARVILIIFYLILPLKGGVTACVPSSPVNSLAILPGMEKYNGQFYDIKCEFLLVN